VQHALGVGGLSVALRSRGCALSGEFDLDLPLWKVPNKALSLTHTQPDRHRQETLDLAA
jgi:hypothetical protein